MHEACIGVEVDFLWLSGEIGVFHGWHPQLHKSISTCVVPKYHINRSVWYSELR